MYIINLLPCRHVTGLSSHPQIWNMYHYQLTLCILTRGADYTPTSLLAPPLIFRPSYGPVSHVMNDPLHLPTLNMYVLK